ncbi:undecaprenyldiphospho-muramoylpentapeptide beta-N-acetylglucosaminyltransferase [Geomicrobium sp. JSM 1781026]|uniref:undecaprenyldiphospho-muramoylpentapeptide beta-N-acetylglucosaminyltransferase n=1 Tax=Geomicrobium sp. JSM 1781026 TaxID=3344580 RepID=UPI0035BED41A
MKVLLTGGGTGGHIYPALALVHTIQKQNPDAQFLYVGTENGLESTIVPKQNIPFQTIEISGFKRKLSFENVKTVQRFLRGTKKAKSIIKQFQPDVAIGTGGYVAGPVMYAASKAGVPTIIHEQNSIPGLTNKFLSRYADRVAISFHEAKQYFKEEKVVFTGNPRATEALEAPELDIHNEFGMDRRLPIVLVVGGSRGARPIHEAFLDALPKMTDKTCQFLYVTGDVHYDKVKETLNETKNAQHVVIRPFLHNMPSVLKRVDAIISRAGATTLAEITAMGIPSILIPSPYVTNNHQEHNARSLERVGAAIVRKESEWTAEQMEADLAYLFQDQNQLQMSDNAKKAAVPDAGERMYALVQELMNSGSST